MARGTLVYKLPEEIEEFKDAQDGTEWKSLMLDILNHLRGQLKYAEIPNEKRATYEEIHQLIWNSIEDRKLKA